MYYDLYKIDKNKQTRDRKTPKIRHDVYISFENTKHLYKQMELNGFKTISNTVDFMISNSRTGSHQHDLQRDKLQQELNLAQETILFREEQITHLQNKLTDISTALLKLEAKRNAKAKQDKKKSGKKILPNSS